MVRRGALYKGKNAAWPFAAASHAAVLHSGSQRHGPRSAAKRAAGRVCARSVRRAGREILAAGGVPQGRGAACLLRAGQRSRKSPLIDARAHGREERRRDQRLSRRDRARVSRLFRRGAGGRALLRRGNVPPRHRQPRRVAGRLVRGLRVASGRDPRRGRESGQAGRTADLLHLHVRPARKRGQCERLSRAAQRFFH